MYKVAYITGDSNSVSSTLQSTINHINLMKGVIQNIVQSQSTSPQGWTIVSITIVYSISKI
ncbi:hypothetical protein J2783_000389 [Chryseobacterium sediminis]|nr:hypothetical protein [Chryseobacterium sediminis]